MIDRLAQGPSGRVALSRPSTPREAGGRHPLCHLATLLLCHLLLGCAAPAVAQPSTLSHQQTADFRPTCTPSRVVIWHSSQATGPQTRRLEQELEQVQQLLASRGVWVQTIDVANGRVRSPGQDRVYRDVANLAQASGVRTVPHWDIVERGTVRRVQGYEGLPWLIEMLGLAPQGQGAGVRSPASGDGESIEAAPPPAINPQPSTTNPPPRNDFDQALMGVQREIRLQVDGLRQQHDERIAAVGVRLEQVAESTLTLDASVKTLQADLAEQCGDCVSPDDLDERLKSLAVKWDRHWATEKGQFTDAWGAELAALSEKLAAVEARTAESGAQSRDITALEQGLSGLRSQLSALEQDIASLTPCQCVADGSLGTSHADSSTGSYPNPANPPASGAGQPPDSAGSPAASGLSGRWWGVLKGIAGIGLAVAAPEVVIPTTALGAAGWLARLWWRRRKQRSDSKAAGGRVDVPDLPEELDVDDAIDSGVDDEAHEVGDGGRIEGYPSLPDDYSKVFVDHIRATGTNEVALAAELESYLAAMNQLRVGDFEVDGMTSLEMEKIASKITRWVKKAFRSKCYHDANQQNLHHRTFQAYLYRRAVQHLKDGSFGTDFPFALLAASIEERVDAHFTNTLLKEEHDAR